MKTTLLAVLTSLSLLAVAPFASAEQSPDKPWLVRVRAVHIDTANHSDAGSNGLTAATLPEDAIHVSDKTIPEVDISYFVTSHIAAELILTYPQKHDVSITSGPLSEGIGSFKHLPPTLTLQYHFQPEKKFKPYVGAGINFTNLTGVELHSTIANTDLGLDHHSVGPALQAGFDYEIAPNVYLNVDIKKTYIRSDLLLNGAKVSEVKVDPLLIGVGIGWRF